MAIEGRRNNDTALGVAMLLMNIELLIGTSMSESHSSDFNVAFSLLLLYIIMTVVLLHLMCTVHVLHPSVARPAPPFVTN